MPMILPDGGDPRFEQAAGLLQQAANAVGIAGDVAVGAIVVEASKLITSAIQQGAKLSQSQAIVFEQMLSVVGGTVVGSAVGAGGAMAIAQLADQVRLYGRLESSRGALQERRRRVLAELAAEGAARTQYDYAEANLRGVEVTFSTDTARMLSVRDLSFTVAQMMVLNPALAIVGAAIALADHLIWSKRIDAERRRRNRAVALFAIHFAGKYDARDRVAGMIREYRASEEQLYINDRIATLGKIKSIYDEADQARGEVYDLLSLPDQNFVDGLGALTVFYQKVNALTAAELDKLEGALRMKQAARPVVGAAGLQAGLVGVVAGAFLLVEGWKLLMRALR